MKKITKKKIFKTAKKLIELNGNTTTLAIKNTLWDMGYDNSEVHQTIVSDMMDELYHDEKFTYTSNGAYRTYETRVPDVIKDVFIKFLVSDRFHFTALVDTKNFQKENEISTTSSDEDYMFTLEFSDHTGLIWDTDNTKFIFNTFYKLLKKEKYNKLIKYCLNGDTGFDEDYIFRFKQELEDCKDEILSNLKIIKKEYKINI